MHWVASAEYTGVVSRNVRCERCKEPYHYELRHTARGSARAGSEESAVDQAKARAESNAMAALVDGTEIVPCPICGWLQRDMVRQVQLKRVRWMLRIGVIGLFVAAMTWLILPMPKWFAPPSELSEEDWSRLWRMCQLISIPAAVVGLCMLALRALVLRGKLFPISVNTDGEIVSTTVGIPGKAPADRLQRRKISDEVTYSVFQANT
jgi:hypothetical protein